MMNDEQKKILDSSLITHHSSFIIPHSSFIIPHFHLLSITALTNRRTVIDVVKSPRLIFSLSSQAMSLFRCAHSRSPTVLSNPFAIRSSAIRPFPSGKSSLSICASNKYRVTKFSAVRIVWLSSNQSIGTSRSSSAWTSAALLATRIDLIVSVGDK
jgi:hypothetical protein